MTTAYTSLLGLALPVTGELSGTWGDTVNNSITSLLDSAIAGTTTLSADTTLTTTTGASNQARQAILLCTGHSANITITAPAQSKIYTVINASATYTVKIRGAGPTTGITIPISSTATVAWNGSDFVDASGYINGNLKVNGTLSVTGTATIGGNTAVTGTLSATGLVSATNATSSFKAIHLGAVTEFSTLNYDGISTAVVDRYDLVPAGKSYFTYVGASAITTLSSTGLAVTGTINANGGSANPLPSNFSILATSGVAKLYSYWSDNSARGSFEFHVAGGNGSLDLTAFTITDGASAKVKNVISVGDATPSTSGAGITFPATQSASSDANTLDDYEEGTWTPAPNFSTTNGFTAGSVVGTYTKVGRLVSATFLLTFDKGTSVGNFTITGLPFTNISSVAGRSGAGISYLQRVGAASKVFTAVIFESTAVITPEFVSQSSSGTISNVTAADMDANTVSIAMTINYQTT